MVIFTVSGEEAALRIEQLVMRRLGVSRREARALCESGAVRVAGRRARKGDRALSGSEVEVSWGEPRVAPQPELPLDVRLERKDLVVVAKPAGMPSVPLLAGERGTLANALLARYPEMSDFGWSPREPGLVHRLDTQTSGLLIAARTRAAFEALVDALKRGALEKSYYAVVEERGLLESDEIRLALRPDPRRDGRVLAERPSSPRDPRLRSSRYRVLERGPEWALVEVEAPRAYRHQVRAHLAAIGHPIVGDVLYGGATDARLGARHALHAGHVACAGEAILSFSVTDEVPEVFRALVEDSESRSPS